MRDGLAGCLSLPFGFGGFLSLALVSLFGRAGLVMALLDYYLFPAALVAARAIGFPCEL